MQENSVFFDNFHSKVERKMLHYGVMDAHWGMGRFALLDDRGDVAWKVLE